ncbi:MAG: protease pro-enzyme activation domain-containing protein [Solirubrobacteraceae bacterium]
MPARPRQGRRAAGAWGHAPALPAGLRARGPLVSSRSLRVDVVLASSDPQGLSSYAQAVSTPGSSDYRRYLSPPEFAVRFGASASAVDTVQAALRAESLHVQGESANHLVLHVQASAGSFEHAWHTSIDTYVLPGGATGFVNSSAPQLPASAAAHISAVVGLDSLVSARPQAMRQAAPAALARPGGQQPRQLVAHQTAGPQPTSVCTQEIGDASTQLGSVPWTYPDLAQAYQYDDLYAGGDEGSGTTVALIEFAPYVSSDITTFEDCYSSPPDPAITNYPVDGGAGSPVTSGSASVEGGEQEAELDIETIIGLAPQASIDVYEGPLGATDSNILDTYTQAIDNPVVNVISTSWGECEAAEDPSLINAEATLFQQAAVEGKTVVAAAGDDGSEDCDGVLSGSAGTALAVDDPASQPYVTGVGGTYLQSLGPAPAETVWNGNASDGLSGGASGGGVSSLWPMPSYQADAAASLGVINANSSCPSGSGLCREVPDVSADAGAPVAVYCTETGSEGCGATGDGGWTAFGGTSLAAPTWAALFALADSSSACDGTPLGFANPALYNVASGAGYASAFNDITSGNNDLLDAHDGTYAAGPGYDMASGLGSPIAGSGSGSDDGLVTQLCKAARPAIPPPTQTGTVTTATATTPATATATAAPAVAKITPTAGRKAGGAVVTISGSGFSHVSAVHFGSRRAKSFKVDSTKKIVAIAPAGSGTVYVTVSTGAGASRRVKAGRFAYLARPAVLRLSPDSGPSAGGTRVTVFGTGFTRVSAVRFGNKRARSFRVRSAGKLVAVAPAAAGRQPVRVSTPGGTSRVGRAARFRFRTR